MTGSFLASILIKVTIILALGLGALRFLRQSPAAVRHLLLLAVCATVLTLPLAALVLPVFAIPLPYHLTGTVESAVPETQPHVAFTPASAGGLATPSAARSSEAMSLTRLVLIVEGLGATLALLPVIAGLWQTRRLRATARQWSRGQKRIERLAKNARIRRPIDVVVHDGLPGPVTYGVWRPVVLFPADATHWRDEDFEGAAIHELEHVRRHDWVTDCFARVVCAVYWFHPLIWTTWRQLRLESERSADDAVVRAQEATAYADLLVSLAERLVTDQRNYGIAMASRRDLPMRIQALLDTSLPRGRVGRRCVLATVLIAASVVLGVAPLITDVQMAAAELGPRVASSVALTDLTKAQGPVAILAPTEPLVGLWELHTAPSPEFVELRLCYAELFARPEVRLDQLEGLSRVPLADVDGPIRFTLWREAGVFRFDGTSRAGAAGGTYVFEPSPAFAADLERLGVQSLTASQQLALAHHGIGIASIARLQSPAAPSVPRVLALLRDAQIRAHLEDLHERGGSVPGTHGVWC